MSCSDCWFDRCTATQFCDLIEVFMRILLTILCLLILVLVACTSKNEDEQRVYYINSYHEGYGSSDDVMEGIVEVLENKVDLKIFFMDTKRNNNPKFIEGQVTKILEDIDSYKPDVILASDDNAVKYVIAPHFKEGDTPVVFCGVNWSAEQYGLSTKSVTGMLEVLPFIETVKIVQKSFPAFKNLTILSENTTSEQKNKVVMQPLFTELELDVTFSLVDDFESWKEAFKQANENSDIIYMPTNSTITGWNADEAKSVIDSVIKKPIITCDDFMMPYAVFGLTKVAKEQGEWAANTALKIMDGARVSDFTLAENSMYLSWINEHLADKIGFEVPAELIPDINAIE